VLCSTSLPALDVAPPFVFWAREEIAIDLVHHAVYALAAGAAYQLIAAGPAEPHTMRATFFDRLAAAARTPRRRAQRGLSPGHAASADTGCC
jgi:hypothetical protein